MRSLPPLPAARLSVACLGFALLAVAAPVEARTEPRGPSLAFKIAPQRPGIVDAYILSFGLWGAQSVFESEAKGASRVLESQLGSEGRSIVRFNTKRTFAATPEALLAAMRTVGRTLDPEEDVLGLVLTSHGGAEGIGMVPGRDRRLLRPEDLGYLLQESR